MPKQWERSLSKIPRLTDPGEIWREATERAVRERLPEPRPPRRQRIVAGVVAVGVFMAAAFFAWQAFEGAGTRHRVGETDETTIPEAPSQASLRFARPAPDATFPVPTATLEFGDFSAELKPTGTSFVKPFSTTYELPSSSLGLPEELPLQMAGDAKAATMKVYASPDFDRDPIATYDLAEGPGRLPDRPGVYYLVVRAEWSDGWTSYLWCIPVVRPGTLQFMLNDHRRSGEGTADLWIDGRHVTGAVVRRTQIEEEDSPAESLYPSVAFEDGSYVPVEAGALLRVIDAPTELSAALTGPAWADASGPGAGFPLFGSRARVPAEPGRHLLVLDATWQEGELGSTGRSHQEKVRFAFPVDVSSSSVPSPEPLPSGPIVITLDSSEKGKIPRATATLGGKEYPAVMNSYRFTIDGEVFESSDQYRDAAMIGAATIVVPPGARIEFEGDQDRVLVGWGNGELAPADPVFVQGSPGDAVVLRFRGEWGGDSFVQWELFLEIQR